MLRLIAYDIADDRRLRRVAKVCEDFGVRVQKSLFECWLDEDRFEEMWSRLLDEMNEKEDYVVAYPIDSGSTRKRRTAGKNMICTEKRTRYVF
jgi:CRISPR-associated protein Cas2